MMRCTPLVLVLVLAAALDGARGFPIAGGAMFPHGGGPGARGSSWRTGHGDDIFSTPVVSKVHNTVFVGAGRTSVYAVEAITGALKWQVQTGGPVYATPLLTADANETTLYFGSTDCRMYQVKAATGEEFGLLDIPPYHTFGLLQSSPALSIPGTLDRPLLFFGSMSDHSLYALDVLLGDTKWRYEPPESGQPLQPSGPVWSSPAVSPDGQTVFVGTGNGKLHAVDASTGIQKWNFTTGGYIWSSPAVSADGKTVFVGSGDHKVYAVDASGIEKWSYTTGDSVYSSPTLSHDGKTVFVGSDDAKLYALDAELGHLVWHFTTAGVFGGSNPALSPDGATVFAVGNDAGTLYAVDARTGVGKWSFTTFESEGMFSSPAVRHTGGPGWAPDTLTVYVGANFPDNPQKLYAVDGYTGIQMWNFTGTSSHVESSPAMSVDGAVVFVGMSDKEPDAADAGTATPTASTAMIRATTSLKSVQAEGDNGNEIDQTGGGDSNGTIDALIAEEAAKINTLDVDTQETADARAPALLPCDGRDGEACALIDLSAWCCNLEAHRCVCAQHGTADELRQICSVLQNGGIDCEECEAAPQCGAGLPDGSDGVPVISAAPAFDPEEPGRDQLEVNWLLDGPETSTDDVPLSNDLFYNDGA